MTLSFWHIFVDFAILAILLVFLIIGWKRGVVRSLICFAGSVLAIGVSVFASRYASDFIYSSFFKEAIVKKIETSIEVSAEETKSSKENSEVLPGFLKRIMLWRGMNRDAISRIIFSSHPAEKIEVIVSPIITGILRLLLSSLLFWIFMIIVRKLARFADSFFKFPILYQINSILGAAFGLCKGLFIVWISVMVIKTGVIYSNSKSIFKEADSSPVFGKFYSFNPIGEDYLSRKTSEISSILYENFRIV
ncbi:MAG: CvpA family protein [Oscillospiraceae bacterium]|nr:CvpA family protein [Oscillospiraceae bacterium]